MVDMVQHNLPAILIALAIVAILAFLVFRPRQSVRLSDTAPVRPHMESAKSPSREGQGLAAEAAAAASDVTGEIISAPVHRELGDGASDDFQRMKGVGPKFADMLNARGFTRFNQLAGLSPEEIERLDSELGAFRGRIDRDRVVEQADYLSRGDHEGYEQRFGKL